MSDTAMAGAVRSRGRRLLALFGTGRSGRRHPVLAAVMVVPLAVLLAVGFGGWDAVVVQASSVAVLLGR